MIPTAVEAMGKRAFFRCTQLTTVNLGVGLKEIGVLAFMGCIRLHEISIPSTVKTIKDGTFYRCLSLTNVNLGEGLEKIGKEAFRECVRLQRLVIPPTVTKIHKKAFFRCPSLRNVVFCDEIEEFVTAESIRNWWNHGVNENSLRTYCFFVRCRIPKRLGLVQPRKWQNHIHGMLKRIPLIPPKRMYSYFNFVDSKLSAYESLKDAATMLELAIWKSKINKRFNRNKDALTVDTKMQCRSASIAMVTIIVLNVLSFLTDGDDGMNFVVGSEGEGGDDNSDTESDESEEDDEDDSFWDGDGDEGGGEEVDIYDVLMANVLIANR